VIAAGPGDNETSKETLETRKENGWRAHDLSGSGESTAPVYRTSVMHRHERHECHGWRFALYLWGFLMTVNCWCVWGPSCQRHSERHWGNSLSKRLSRYLDGDDAHNGGLQVFS